MIRGTRVALAVLLVGTAAGCGRLGLNDGPTVPRYDRYEPLPAAPTAPVTQGTLQPLAPPPPGAPGVAPVGTLDPNAPPPPAVAAPPPGVPGKPAQVAEATPQGQPIGRTELLGGWRLTSGSDNCQLFMNLTSWAGGYRAISKGCNSPELAKISAWDLQGRQVTLKGSDGSTVATLNSAGGEKYNGTTAGRLPVSLSR